VIGDRTLDDAIRASAGLGGRKLGLAGIDWSELAVHLRTAVKAAPGEYLCVHVHCAEKR